MVADEDIVSRPVSIAFLIFLSEGGKYCIGSLSTLGTGPLGFFQGSELLVTGERGYYSSCFSQCNRPQAQWRRQR
ncbi:hypothetical protein I3842_15G130600 [Carya illinoinensis]|uniref:Uncharacterized protein n=1 Tax=Carya illinoinensis TaxID=32201 RepID=A0A922A8M3_CARIL|nr:hypothetical protein I3842_15G130600 [Carya illinoinensis]KAG6675965.1 hypothetical protein I3842_15G130600 [Carya illinoinensis]